MVLDRIKSELADMPAKLGRRQITAMILLIVFILFRLWLVRDAILNPGARYFVDSQQYLNLATDLLNHGTYHDETGGQIDLFRSPGYSALLAAILALTGRSVSAVVLLQLGLNLCSAYLLYQIGKLLRVPRAGLASSIILLASPNSLFWSVAIMSECAFAFGLILAFLLTPHVVRGSFPAWGLGIVLAVLTYIRPIGMYMILIWAGAIFFGGMRITGKGPAMRRALWLGMSAGILLLPWYVRNAIAYHETVFATVSRTTIQSYHLGLTLADAEDVSWEEAKAQAFEMGGGLGTMVKIAAQYPSSFAKVQIKGIVRTFLGMEIPTWEKMITGKDHQAYGLLEGMLSGDISRVFSNVQAILHEGDFGFLMLLIWGLGYDVLLYGLAVAGLLRMRNTEDDLQKFALALVLVSIAYLAISPGAAGEARFRVPIEPLLALLSGFAWIGRKSPAEVQA